MSKKEIKIPYDFYYKVEDLNYLKRVLYSDTDSLFLHVFDEEELRKRNYSFENKEEVDRLEEEVVIPLGKQINEEIQEYWNENILSKMNIPPEWNTIDFKIEMIIDKIFFPGPKKRYVYRIHKKEGAYFNPPTIKVTGIEIKRTDTAPITKVYMKKILDILFSSNNRKELEKNIMSLVKEIKEDFKRVKNEYDFDYVGIPSSWGFKEYKEAPTYVYGAMLYNSLVQDIVRPGTKGFRIHINLNKRKIGDYLKELKIESQYQLDYSAYTKVMDKLNVLFLPPGYNKQKIIELEKNGYFKIDWKEQYDKVIKTKLEDLVKID